MACNCSTNALSRLDIGYTRATGAHLGRRSLSGLASPSSSTGGALDGRRLVIAKLISLYLGAINFPALVGPGNRRRGVDASRRQHRLWLSTPFGYLKIWWVPQQKTRRGCMESRPTLITYWWMFLLLFFVFRFVFSLSGFFIPFFTFCYRFHCGFSVFVAYCTVREASCIVFDIHSYV